MIVAMRAPLLLLLAVVCTNAAETTDDCELQRTNDLPAISGNWVLVWSVTNSPIGQALLPRVNSSHLELTVADNDTILLTERNVYIDNKCGIYYMNASVPTAADQQSVQINSITFEQDGQSGPFNDSAEIVFYKSCPDCMQLFYNGTAMGQYLLIYRREGTHRDVEHLKAVEDDYKKMAECLGFPHDKPYVYDGVSDFCHKKSAPAVDAAES